jgi:diacylglycerol kinase (ATP)
VADIIVILNPSARSERATRMIEAVRGLGGNVDIRFTTGPGDAQRLAAAAAAEGSRIVVAAGGDGTVGEVANGLAGSATALGVLPLGTMNVFSKELGIPAELSEAWKIVLAGHIREIDLPKANDQYFVQLAGVGLDAQIVQETTWQAKRKYGPLSYVFSAAHVALRTPPRLQLECNGSRIACSFVLVGNGRFYGSKIVLFPEAKMDDRKLDLVVFKDLGFLDIMRYLGGVLFRRHTGLAGVKYIQTSDATIHCDQEVPVELDGEVSGTTPVRFLMDQRLRVVVPLGAGTAPTQTATAGVAANETSENLGE